MTRTACILIFLFISAIAWSEEPVIGEPLEEAGTRLELDSGDSLQLSVDDKAVIGYFIDNEGSLIESLAESILFEIDQPSHRNDEWRTVLRLANEAKLTSPRKLVGPYNFKVKLIIRFKDGTTKTFSRASVELDKESE